MVQENEKIDCRARICKSLGIENIIELHKIIINNRTKVESLLEKRLFAKILTELGYDVSSMRKLGYDDFALNLLGYKKSEPHTTTIVAEQHRTHKQEPAKNDIHQLIKSNCRAQELRQYGFTIHQCKDAGYDVRELARLGFSLNELSKVYTINQLKAGGYGARELRDVIKESDLRKAFSAIEMKNAGFSAKELHMRLHYPDNQIRTAGYSNKELVEAGFAITSEKKR